MDKAIREAYNNFDKWNEVTGCVTVDSGWEYELLSIIEDAVHIGAQMAIYGKIKKDTEGNIVYGPFVNKSGKAKL